MPETTGGGYLGGDAVLRIRAVIAAAAVQVHLQELVNGGIHGAVVGPQDALDDVVVHVGEHGFEVLHGLVELQPADLPGGAAVVEFLGGGAAARTAVAAAPTEEARHGGAAGAGARRLRSRLRRGGRPPPPRHGALPRRLVGSMGGRRGSCSPRPAAPRVSPRHAAASSHLRRGEGRKSPAGRSTRRRGKIPWLNSRRSIQFETSNRILVGPCHPRSAAGMPELGCTVPGAVQTKCKVRKMALLPLPRAPQI